MTQLTREEIEAYHRRKGRINSIVLTNVQRGRGTLYGGHALNSHLDPFLDRPTEDFDVYTRESGKKQAQIVEDKLDRAFGGNFFEVRKGQHPGTYRVRSRVTEQEVADFTRQPKNLPSQQNQVMGRRVSVVTIPFIKNRIRKTLRDEKSEFRHAKDRDALRRIAVQEELNKRKKLISGKRISPSHSRADMFSIPFFTKPIKAFRRI